VEEVAVVVSTAMTRKKTEVVVVVTPVAKTVTKKMDVVVMVAVKMATKKTVAVEKVHVGNTKVMTMMRKVIITMIMVMIVAVDTLTMRKN
jgi:hypothetical protein